MTDPQHTPAGRLSDMDRKVDEFLKFTPNRRDIARMFLIREAEHEAECEALSRQVNTLRRERDEADREVNALTIELVEKDEQVNTLTETLELIAGPSPRSHRIEVEQLRDAVKWRQGVARDALASAPKEIDG